MDAAGLIGVDSTVFKYKSASGIHADNLPCGVFLIQNRSTNDGYPAEWGLIVSMTTGFGAGLQLYFDASTTSKNLKYRVQWDTVWGTWISV